MEDERLVDNTEARWEGDGRPEGSTDVVSRGVSDGTEAIEDEGSIENRPVSIIPNERRHVENRLEEPGTIVVNGSANTEKEGL